MPASSLGLTPSQYVAQCPCCARDRTALFERFPHRGLTLDYRICTYCGLVFLSPRFSELELREFYRVTYRSVYTTEASDAKDIAAQRQRAHHLAGMVTAAVGAVGSHLDIGCSTGELLRAIRTQANCPSSTGVEPLDRHREQAIDDGWQVYPSLDRTPLPAAGFELITLSHVLEHLPEPLAFLRTLRRDYLAPTGIMLIEVPNLLGHISFESAHLFCFWRKTLPDMLGMAGLRTVVTKVHDDPRDPAGARYLAVIAAPSGAPAVPPAIRYVPWRAVKVSRMKGLRGDSWPRFVLRAAIRGPALLWRTLTHPR